MSHWHLHPITKKEPHQSCVSIFLLYMSNRLTWNNRNLEEKRYQSVKNRVI